MVLNKFLKCICILKDVLLHFNILFQFNKQ